MKYSYRYYTESTFVPVVERHFFKLRTIPCCNEFQRVDSPKFEIHPVCHLLYGRDSLGNDIQWGSFDYDHDRLQVLSEGIVNQTSPYCLHEVPAPFYIAPTRLTECPSAQERVRALIRLFGQDPWILAEALMHEVHHYITYTPCCTSVDTTAAEVWQDPRGVCQDYAHLMLAMCRIARLSARYVCGFIEGEGQTHAWVEVSDGNCWRPFDPTLDQCPEWGYIKIAHGRDANDCPTNRGRIYSWTRETMSVLVQLTPIE